eukprot:s5143_g6.t2
MTIPCCIVLPVSALCPVSLQFYSIVVSPDACQLRLVSRQELEGLTGTVIAGPDHQGLYQMKMMIEDGELDTVVVNAENITLRLRRSALPELAQSVPAESHEAPLELEGVPFLAAVHQATRPSSTSPQRASARPKVRFCPTVSVEPISARSSRVVSLSAAAAECLVASGDVSQHALTEQDGLSWMGLA